MRVLAFSDLHDEEDAFEKLKRFYASSDFDLVLIAGDTTNLSYFFLEEVVTSFKNCFFIHGNNEPMDVVEKAAKLDGFLHGKTRIFKGLEFAGFGYSGPTPFGTPGELSEDEIYQQMSRMEINSDTILVTHSPPFGIFDETKKGNAGSKAILRILQEKNPFVHFCGHIHEHQGMENVGATTVVKIPALRFGSCCVAEIDGRTIRVEFPKLQ